jgi:hypothetical protein
MERVRPLYLNNLKYRVNTKCLNRLFVLFSAILIVFLSSATFSPVVLPASCARGKDSELHLISFATNPTSLAQLREEAKLVPLFKSVRLCNETCLHGTPFWAEHSHFIENNPRGYGYWIWKYALVLKTMENLPECSAILYIDGGCSLNINGMKRLAEYTRLARSSGGLLLFDLGLQEAAYTKRDTGERISPHSSNDSWGTQRVGGIFTAINMRHTRQFFRQALKIASEHGYHYLDDSPSLKPENPEFISHRHDQSITSMLSKQYGFPAIPDETYPPERCLEAGYPIIAARRNVTEPYAW